MCDVPFRAVHFKESNDTVLNKKQNNVSVVMDYAADPLDVTKGDKK